MASKVAAAGSIIAGRFQLVAQVATGGMGTVHRAFDLGRQRAVAVKLLTEVGSTEAADRFRREATLLSELRHPGIVEYVDAGLLEDGGMYMAMQWLEGTDLAQKLALGPLSSAQSVRLVRVVAEALSAAHARGVLHRDVKPQNVFLREGDPASPVLLDFGIATLAHVNTGITKTGLTIGTPGFMAPEQARGERGLDARVDVYGLGCLLFQCITGSPPFVGPSPVAIVAEVLLSTAPRLRTRVPDVPAELDDLVAEMLEKDRSARPRDALAVAERLRRIESTLKLPSHAGAPAVSGEERRMVAVVGVVQPRTAQKGPAATVPMRGLYLPRVAADHRGDLKIVDQTAAFIVFSSDESIVEAASRAAAAALVIARTDPELMLSIAVGPSQVRAGLDGAIVERLAAMATVPGAIVTDATARGMLLAKFELAHGDRGYRLVSARVGDEPSRHVPFLGRDRELRALADTFEAVVEEGSARAAIVVGGAGLGKSRLLRELFIRLEARSPTPAVIDARAEPMRKDTPLSTIGQLVRRGLTVVEGAEPEEQTALLRLALESLVPREELTRVTSFLAVAADVPRPPGATSIEIGAALRDPQLLEDQIGRAFVSVLTGFVRQAGAVALIVDDAQWMDSVSARIVGRAVRKLQETPLCFLAFARPELDDRLPHALRDVPLERIQLGGLPKKAAEKLVRGALGEDLPQPVLERIVQQGEGSPLFLQELVEFALERRSDRVPTGVLATLEGRLLRLEPTARKVLRAASVFGETFWSGGVAALLGEGSTEAKALDAWLVFLVERDLLTLRRTTRFPRETEFAFRHSLMRDVAYTMLTPEDRARGHRLAAAWLEAAGEREPTILATHLDAAGEATSAAKQWARAARIAYERNDAARAVECAERSLLQGASGRDRAETLVVMTNALSWTGQVERAEQRGLEAVASFIPGSQGWVDAMSALLRIQARSDEGAAVEGTRKLVEAVRRDPSLHPVAEPLSAIIPVALRRGLHALAADVLGVLGEAALAHAPNDPAVRASILRCRSWQALFDWDYARCAACDAEALDCFSRAGDQRQACQSYFDLGFDFMMLADYERARQIFEEARSEAKRLGMEGLEHLIEHNLSFTLHRLGHSEEALAMQRRCIASANERRDRVGEGHARRYLAIILQESGETAAASDEFERSLRCGEGMSIRWDTLARLGLLALTQGNLPLARLRITEATHGLKELRNAEDGDMMIRLASIELARTEGDDARMYAELAEAKKKLMETADRIPTPEHRASFLERWPEHARLLVLARDTTDVSR